MLLLSLVPMLVKPSNSKPLIILKNIIFIIQPNHPLDPLQYISVLMEEEGTE